MRLYRRRIDASVNALQKRIETIELKEIQEEYARSIPAFIWILKGLIVVAILYGLSILFFRSASVSGQLAAIVMIVVSCSLLVGIWNRARWAWHIGLIVFGLFVLVGMATVQLIAVLLGIILFLLTLLHGDYLNNRSD